MFSVIAAGHALNFSMAGIILLIILFQGSITFTESITLAKYPEYRDYQITTPGTLCTSVALESLCYIVHMQKTCTRFIYSKYKQLSN